MAGRPASTAKVVPQAQAVPALPAAPQAAPQAAPSDRQIMSAAIAQQLQATFTSLISQPARLGDVEGRILAPQVEPCDVPDAGDDAEGVPESPEESARRRWLPTPQGPVSDVSLPTAADYGSRGGYPDAPT